MGDPKVAGTAASTFQRYSANSLIDLLADIVMLSESDFLVCTFSSQVCRVAYELMQAKYPDASER